MKTFLPLVLIIVAALTMSFRKKEYKVAVTYTNGRTDTITFISNTSNRVKERLEDTGICLRYKVKGLSKQPIVLTCSVKDYSVSTRKISKKEMIRENIDEQIAFQFRRKRKGLDVISYGMK